MLHHHQKVTGQFVQPGRQTWLYCKLLLNLTLFNVLHTFSSIGLGCLLIKLVKNRHLVLLRWAVLAHYVIMIQLCSGQLSNVLNSDPGPFPLICELTLKWAVFVLESASLRVLVGHALGKNLNSSFSLFFALNCWDNFYCIIMSTRLEKKLD